MHSSVLCRPSVLSDVINEQTDDAFAPRQTQHGLLAIPISPE